MSEQSCFLIKDNLIYDATESLKSLSEESKHLLLSTCGTDINQHQNLPQDILNSIESMNIIGQVDKKQPDNEYKKQYRFKQNQYLSYTANEVSKHNNANDIWIILDNSVYDFTQYQYIHPGSAQVIVKNAGKDATHIFKEVSKHTEAAYKFRENYLIGSLKK